MAVIKPHCVNEKLAGQIIEDIKQRGFEIKAAEMFYLDRPAAEEFLDVYKGVIPQYCVRYPSPSPSAPSPLPPSSEDSDKHHL